MAGESKRFSPELWDHPRCLLADRRTQPVLFLSERSNTKAAEKLEVWRKRRARSDVVIKLGQTQPPGSTTNNNKSGVTQQYLNTKYN